MRFQEVSDHLLQFEAVRGACSRRWQVSESLVMCTELDLAGYIPLSASPLHSAPSRGEGPGFLRVTFVRFHGEQRHTWTDAVRTPGLMNQAEQNIVATYRGLVREWVLGDRKSLPPSNVTRAGVT